MQALKTGEVAVAAVESDEDRELKELQAQIDSARTVEADTLGSVAASTKVARKRLEAEAAQRAAEAAKVIQQFTAKLGPRGIEWDTIDTASGIVVLVKPTRTRYNEWMADGASLDPAKLMALVSPSVKHPSLVEFDKYLTKEPAKITSAASVVNRLGGANVKDAEGKSRD
jgi:hypothetical protein